MRLRPRNLRTRLTLWYVAMLASLLVLAWGGTCLLLFLQLRSQLDHFAVQEIETVEGLFYFAPDGQLHMREDYHNHPESKDLIERYLEVLEPDGTVLLRNERLGVRTLDGPTFAGEGVGGYSQRTARLSDGTPVRLVSRVHILEGRRVLIRLAHDEGPLLARMRDLLLASLIVLPVVLACAGFAGYSLAKRALAPIEEMARRAQEITPERLDARLANDYSDDELRRLAGVFNDTLARLEQAFEQLRRFTADVSHELRTPLAMIRSVGEVGLQKDGGRAEYRDIVGSMLEEVNRLTSLLDNLLTISRADAGHIRLHRTTVPVLQLVRESVAIFEILIEEKALRVTVTGDENAQAEGDYVFLRQAFVNVIHNAVKYSPVGGAIDVRLSNSHGELEGGDRGPRPRDSARRSAQGVRPLLSGRQGPLARIGRCGAGALDREVGGRSPRGRDHPGEPAERRLHVPCPSAELRERADPYPVIMDARQWSKAAWALALVFASLPLMGRFVMGDWEFIGAAEIACLLLLVGGYFHVRSRRYLTKPDPATLLDRANEFARSGRSDKAIALLSKTIRQSPRLWQAYQYRGQLRMRRGEFTLAAVDFSDAIRLAPEEAHLHELLEDAAKNS